MGVLVTGLHDKPIPQVFQHQDLLHHGVAFAALAFTACLAFSRRYGWLAIVLSLVVAGGIELGQYLLPRRTASALDMLADVLGIIIGGGLWVGISSRLGRRRRVSTCSSQ